ncbi:MAG TPA: hypothetical protein VLT33_15490, partial [Labilithrix sp.]|nr:hypothetical protein [Labilithrix sp.]
VIDLASWQVVQCHRIPGTCLLPPVATSTGVYVASLGGGPTRAIGHVVALDRATGVVVSSHGVPGAAYRLAGGPNNHVLELHGSPGSPVERISFLPETQHRRLVFGKHLDTRLVGTAHPRRLEGPAPSRRDAGHVVRMVVPGGGVAAARPAGRRTAGARDEIVPARWDGSEGRDGPRRDGLLGLMALLGAESTILARLAASSEHRFGGTHLYDSLGITPRDPRVRWSSGAGRDPGLLDLAEDGQGDAIATYFYPPSRGGKVPVVLVSRATGEARWLADDFDVWFAGALHDALDRAPEAVHATLAALGLGPDFLRPLPPAAPPHWFFEAHAMTWTLDDARAAHGAGDSRGAERMLVAARRAARGSHLDTAELTLMLWSVYESLGWKHHRAAVAETW